MAHSNPSTEIHPRHRNRRSYSSVMTPIENSAQWREILSKAKSEDRQADEVVVSGETNRLRRRAADLVSVLTPIENSTQWKAAMAGKPEEIRPENQKGSRRRRRRRAADLVSVLTPVENLEQWRSAMAESPAEKNLGDSSAMAGKPEEILRKDSRRRWRRRMAADLVSVLTPIENLEQWRSAMAESPAEKNLGDSKAMAVDLVSEFDSDEEFRTMEVCHGGISGEEESPARVSFTEWLHA